MATPEFLISFASSLDGIIGQDGPLQLSSIESMILTHALRSEYEAILVGSGTVAADSPRLTCRLDELAGDRSGAPVRQPVPVILDSALSTPPDARVLEDAGTRRPVIVWDPARGSSVRASQLEKTGCRLVGIENYADMVPAVRWTRIGKELAALGIRSVFVEGGGKVISSLLVSGIWSRLILTLAPLVCGSGTRWYDAAGAALRFETRGVWRLGPDVILEALPAGGEQAPENRQPLVETVLAGYGLGHLLGHTKGRAGSSPDTGTTNKGWRRGN